MFCKSLTLIATTMVLLIQAYGCRPPDRAVRPKAPATASPEIKKIDNATTDETLRLVPTYGCQSPNGTCMEVYDQNMKDLASQSCGKTTVIAYCKIKVPAKGCVSNSKLMVVWGVPGPCLPDQTLVTSHADVANLIQMSEEAVTEKPTEIPAEIPAVLPPLPTTLADFCSVKLKTDQNFSPTVHAKAGSEILINSYNDIFDSYSVIIPTTPPSPIFSVKSSDVTANCSAEILATFSANRVTAILQTTPIYSDTAKTNVVCTLEAGEKIDFALTCESGECTFHGDRFETRCGIAKGYATAQLTSVFLKVLPATTAD